MPPNKEDDAKRKEEEANSISVSATSRRATALMEAPVVLRHTSNGGIWMVGFRSG